MVNIPPKKCEVQIGQIVFVAQRVAPGEMRRLKQGLGVTGVEPPRNLLWTPTMTMFAAPRPGCSASRHVL